MMNDPNVLARLRSIVNERKTADEAIIVRGFLHSDALLQRHRSPSSMFFPLLTTVADNDSAYGRKRMDDSATRFDCTHRFDKIDAAALILPTIVVTIAACRDRASQTAVDSVRRICREISAQKQQHRNYRFAYDENVVACKLNNIWPAKKQDAQRSGRLFVALACQLPLAIADRIAKYELVLRAPLAIDFLCSRRKRRQILMELGAEWQLCLPVALPESIEAGTGGISLCGYENLIVRLHPTFADSQVHLQFWELTRITKREYSCFWPRVFRVGADGLSFIPSMPTLAVLLRANTKADAQTLGKMVGKLQLMSNNNVLVDCLPIAALREARRAGLCSRWFALPLCDFEVHWNKSPSQQNPNLRDSRSLFLCARTPIVLAFSGCAQENRCFKKINFDMFVVQWVCHRSTPTHYGSVYV